MNSKYNLPFIIFSIIVFSSCVENTIDETGTVNSQDYLIAENIFNDINRLVEDAFIDNGENKSCPKYNIMNVDTSNQDTIILFIDEIHNLVGAGKAEGAMDASNLLKPALARGELHCIGATTLNEYRENIENYRAWCWKNSKSFL